jgi:quercetin dioxygenase-like cupin family protein
MEVLTMHVNFRAMLTGFALAALATTPALAETADGHTVVPAGEIQWSSAPPSLPPGAQAALLYGNPGDDGLFALRLQLPAGYHIPPHTHPRPEVVTVLSGTFLLGMGDSADQAQTKALPAGSFFAFQPGEPHFVFTEEETVVQINSSGPWGIEYLNSQDDPRTD